MKQDQIQKKASKKALLPIAVMVLFFSSYTKAALSSDLILCKNQKTVRTIRVEVDQAKSYCKTIYTKSGVDSIVGSGQYSKSCEQIADNVKKNLETANWDCREVQQSKSSAVTEL